MSNHNPRPTLNLATFDTLVDEVGDPCRADLTLFVNGNQFMVMEELLEAFRRTFPQFPNIYYETLRSDGLIQICSLLSNPVATFLVHRVTAS